MEEKLDRRVKKYLEKELYDYDENLKALEVLRDLETNLYFRNALTNVLAELSNKDKQIEELKQKDKVIDLMAEWIEHKTDITVINKHICKKIRKDEIYECNAKTCIKCIKQYFFKKR